MLLVYSVVSCSVVSNSLQPARLLCPWTSLGKNIGVGCHALLQEIFSTQGLNLGLPNCRQNLYRLSHQGSPRIYEPLEARYTGESALIHRLFTFSFSVCVCVCVCVCMYVCVCACSVVPNSVWPHGLWPTRLLCPWDLPGKNIGSELSFPSPADLPDPGIQSLSLTSPALAVGFVTLRLALNSYSRKYLVYSVAQN